MPTDPTLVAAPWADALRDVRARGPASTLARQLYHAIGGPSSGVTPEWEQMSEGFRLNRTMFVLAGMRAALLEDAP